MSIEEKRTKFVREFSEFDDAFDRMSYLIALSAGLPEPSPDLRRPENLVGGCQSEVWVRVGVRDGLVFMEGYSDTLIIRGILFMLCGLVGGEKPGDAIEVSSGFFEACGITVLLEEGRRNGLGKILETVKRRIHIEAADS